MDDRPNKGIGDYLLIIILCVAWSFYTFGFSWKAFIASMLIVNGSIVLTAILAYLLSKFK